MLYVAEDLRHIANVGVKVHKTISSQVQHCGNVSTEM